MTRAKTTRKRVTKKTTTEEPKAKVLTPEEAAIASRIESEDTGWFGIDEGDIEDFSLMNNPLDISNYPEAKKLQDDRIYVFRWCSRTAEAIDKYTKAAQPPKRWAIVNRSTLPAMARYIDDILGCVCCVDQLLLFKPWSHHMVIKKAIQQISDNVDRAGDLEALAERAPDGVDIMVGEKHRITSSDDVQYEEEADAGEFEDLGDLVVAE